MLDTTERRRAKRFSTRLKVYDRETNNLLGYCEDLSFTGVRLMSEAPIPENRELTVLLDHADDGTGILLTLFRVWQAVSESVPRYYYTGLHIVNPDEETLDNLQDLIHELFVS